MAWRAFKKPSNAPDPTLPNGARVQFTTLDNLVAYYATDNDQVSAGLEALMRTGSGGLTEIPLEEFQADYVEPKKNGAIRKPVWREEIGAKGSVSKGIPVMQQLGHERVQRIVAVAVAADNKPGGVPSAPVAEPAPPPTGSPDLKSTVRTGRRTRTQPRTT